MTFNADQYKMTTRQQWEDYAACRSREGQVPPLSRLPVDRCALHPLRTLPRRLRTSPGPDPRLTAPRSPRWLALSQSVAQTACVATLASLRPRVFQ